MSNENWHYQHKNQEHGPHSLHHIRSLLFAGELTGETLVWHPTLPTWTPLSHTGLDPKPPAMHETPAAAHAGFVPSAPLTWVWALAFAVLIKGASMLFIKNLLNFTAAPLTLPLIISPTVNLILILLDNRTLERAGYRRLRVWPGVLFAPLRLHARRKLHGGSPWPLVVWVILGIIVAIPTMLFVLVGLAFSGFL